MMGALLRNAGHCLDFERGIFILAFSQAEGIKPDKRVVRIADQFNTRAYNLLQKKQLSAADVKWYKEFLKIYKEWHKHFALHAIRQ